MRTTVGKQATNDATADFPDSWVLLRPLKDPDGVPASVRMRRALKCLRRGFRIKAVRVSGTLPVGGSLGQDSGKRGARLKPVQGQTRASPSDS
jgi:hypothetical protein